MKKLVAVCLCLCMVFSASIFNLTPVNATSSTSSTTGAYWLKVNEKRNVVTAYKKINGKWTPIRAMLCSCGVDGKTPKGTFYTKGRYRWGNMMDNVQAQYCTRIVGRVLFHSVWYYNRGLSSQNTYQFNMLGRVASHGCVRLSTIDAKWVYDHCQRGTKVSIYRSDISSPLGRPKGIKVSLRRSTYWDPTDPNSRNPYHIIKKPTITISSKKASVVQYGNSYTLKQYVTSKDPNTFMNLTSLLKVSSVKKYVGGKYVSKSFTTKSLGKYKIVYVVRDPYSKTTYKTFYVTVKDNYYAPIITARNRYVAQNTTNALRFVSAKQRSGYRTSAIKTYIKTPGSTTYSSAYSTTAAKNYIFNKPGTYTIKYTVTNKYSPYKKATKYIKVVVNDNYNTPVISGVADRNVNLGDTNAVDGVSATQISGDITSNIKVTIIAPDLTTTEMTYDEAKEYVFNQSGTYTIQYTVANKYNAALVADKEATINCI